MRKTSEGYIYEVHPGHPLATKKGLVLQHRKVWFDAYGPIPPGGVIHHKNGIKSDNRIENLELTDRSSHMKEHYVDGLGKLNGAVEIEFLKCAICEKTYVRKAHVRRYNKKIKGVTLARPVCSRSCWGKLLNHYRHHALKEQK